ncbi:hypothetical protein M9458_056426 [Cirrhinus mrigala]|uniref:AIG1-type G domain-containing protein n=1 Tax=Cirrhinus mrigala TaxID=683832 RepID=A0ABD0MDC5_CIRMR
MFDTGVDNVEIRKEIVKCISMVAPGPHVFLLMIQLGQFTNEKKEAVKMIQETFGEESRMYTMVLFTRKGQSLCEAEDRHEIEKAKAVQEAEERHKKEKAEVPYRSKRARDWSFYVPVFGGAAGGAVGGIEDIVHWITKKQTAGSKSS